MCNILEKLPLELVGVNVLGYLKLSDLVLLERASASRELRKLFLNLILYAPPLDLSYNQHQNTSVLSWIVKRRRRLQFITINLPGNNPVLSMDEILVENVEFELYRGVTQEDFIPLQETSLCSKINDIYIWGDLNKEVITHICSCIDHVNKLHIRNCSNTDDWLTSNILEKWNLQEVDVSNCSIISIDPLISSFSEVTNLSLEGITINDTTVVAIAQHCLKLKKLDLDSFDLTVASLLALSEQKLPLEWLNLPTIPYIANADIAKRCSHALSRIDSLSTGVKFNETQNASFCIPYMSNVKELFLTDYNFAHMDLIIEHFNNLRSISVLIGACSKVKILSLCRSNPALQELEYYAFSHTVVHNHDLFTDHDLIELIHACPHLRRLCLRYETDITDIGILALSEHCPQLWELAISKCEQVTESAVLQLLQRCRKLCILVVSSSSLSEDTWTQLDKNTQKRVSRC